jgi:membrane protein
VVAVDGGSGSGRSVEAEVDRQRTQAGARGTDPPRADGALRRVRRRIDALQRRHRALAFPYAVVKKFNEDEAGRLGALIAYYGFFSLFPLLLVLVTVLGYALSGDPELQADIVDSTLSQFPVIGEEIQRNVGSLDGNVTALVVGIVGALWAGLGALRAMEHAMDEVWDVPVKRRPGFLRSRLRALAMLAVLGGGVIGIVLLGSAGTASDGLGPLAAVLGAAAGLVLAIAVFLFGFLVLTDNDLPWRAHLPGAVVGGIAFVALQVVGGYYVNRVVQGASDTYGFFAIVIGLLSWMYLEARLALIAAEVNVVRSGRLWPRGMLDDDLTEADERALRRQAHVEERIEPETVGVTIDRSEAHRADAPATGR